jgi:hypothetical protein
VLRGVGDGKADFFGFNGDFRVTPDKVRLNYRLNSARLDKRADSLAIEFSCHKDHFRYDD